MAQNQDDSSGYNPPPKLEGWDVPDVIRQTVLPYIGANESGNRYDIVNGGGRFDTSGGHPLARGQAGPGGQSSASGAFQATRDTWNDIAGEDATMHPENQLRFGFKNAYLGYKRYTGRDLVQDVQEQGLTNDIANTLKTVWAGGPQNASKLRWKMPDGSYGNDTLSEYGGSAPSRRESGNYQPSGGGAGDRWSEENIPYQQQATKAGLLGMLGVNTTENERLALMKAGFRTMQTPGVLGKAIGAGGEAYVDTLIALNRQQAEIANMQTQGKMNESSGLRSRAEAERERATAEKTSKETALLGLEPSLQGVQQPIIENGQLKQYKSVPYDLSAGGNGGGKIVDTSALQTFSNPKDGTQQNAVTAPTNPTEMAPEILQQQTQLGPVSPFDEEHNNKLKIIQNEGAKEYNALASTTGSLLKDSLTKGRDKYYNDLKNYEEAASAARGNQMVNSDLIRTVSNLPENGKLAVGDQTANLRYAWANSYNTLAAMIGEKERLVPDEWKKAIVSDAEAKKLATLQTSITRNANESEKMFATRLGANPGVSIPKETSNRLVATNIVMQKAALDNQEVAKHYGDVTAKAGTNLPYVVNKANPSHQYSRDINAITTLLTKNKNAENAITAYMDGKLDQQTFDQIGKNYGVANLSRYFDSYKNQSARP